MVAIAIRLCICSPTHVRSKCSQSSQSSCLEYNARSYRIANVGLSLPESPNTIRVRSSVTYPPRRCQTSDAWSTHRRCHNPNQARGPLGQGSRYSRVESRNCPQARLLPHHGQPATRYLSAQARVLPTDLDSGYRPCPAPRARSCS